MSITREKTVYVVPNAILICTEEEKVTTCVAAVNSSASSDWLSYHKVISGGPAAYKKCRHGTLFCIFESELIECTRDTDFLLKLPHLLFWTNILF